MAPKKGKQEEEPEAAPPEVENPDKYKLPVDVIAEDPRSLKYLLESPEVDVVIASTRVKATPAALQRNQFSKYLSADCTAFTLCNYVHQCTAAVSGLQQRRHMHCTTTARAGPAVNPVPTFCH